MTLLQVTLAGAAFGFVQHMTFYVTRQIDGMLQAIALHVQRLRRGDIRPPICERCGRDCCYCPNDPQFIPQPPVR